MFNNKYKLIIIFTSLVLLSAFCFLLSASVEAAEPLKLQVQIPCTPIGGGACPTEAETAQSPAAYIARFYQFALALAGMLAFGMIVFGAIQYTVSAGNVAQQSDARDRIFQALWGVALLLGAYLILYTIDPKLVSLKDPNIKKIAVEIEEPKEREKEGGLCKTTDDCQYGFTCQNGKCALSEERKQAQQSAKYQWVDFGDPQIRTRYGYECSGMGKVRYADNYCPSPKPGPVYPNNYQCCGEF